jgi:hypothetical protein
VEGYGGDPLRHPAFHFPPPEIVEGVHEAMKRRFAKRLDFYGKAQKKTPGKFVPAFAAWHVDTTPKTQSGVSCTSVLRWGAVLRKYASSGPL